jgi:protease-4
MLARSLPEMDTQLRFVEDAVGEAKQGGAPVKALAYCFCGF